MSIDPHGDLVVADSGNNEVQEVAASAGTLVPTSANDVYAIAGTGTAGTAGAGSQAITAQLNGPEGSLTDAAGDIYFSNYSNCVDEIPAASGTQWGQSMVAGNLYTVAGVCGSGGSDGHTGDGGAATSAKLYYPQDLALDSNGDLYIADNDNNRIQEVAATTHSQWGQSMTADDIYTIAGSASASAGHSGDGGAASSALLDQPTGLAFDSSGDVLIGDSANNRVQEVAASTHSQWGQSMTADDIYTVAGSSSGSSGSSGDGGSATSARLDGPAGITTDSAGDIYIADTSNNRIQEVAAATDTQWGQSMTTDDVYTVAGSSSGSSGATGDGGAATSGLLNAPNDVQVDGSGNLYIADSGNNEVQEVVASTGTQWGQSMTANDLYTVAGSSAGTSGSSGDGGPATSATFDNVKAISLDPHGDLIVADFSDDVVQEVALSATSGTDSVTTPSGYTLVDSKTSGQTTTSVYTHTVGSDTGVTLSYSTSAPKVAALAVYSGVNTTSPVDAYDDAATSTSSPAAPDNRAHRGPGPRPAGWPMRPRSRSRASRATSPTEPDRRRPLPPVRSVPPPRSRVN
jgi:sugar lactone lactonase YvrE